MDLHGMHIRHNLPYLSGANSHIWAQAESVYLCKAGAVIVYRKI